jgi:hypothetical protein
VSGQNDEDPPQEQKQPKSAGHRVRKREKWLGIAAAVVVAAGIATVIVTSDNFASIRPVKEKEEKEDKERCK